MSFAKLYNSNSFDDWYSLALSLKDTLTDDQKEIVKITGNIDNATVRFVLQNEWRHNTSFRELMRKEREYYNFIIVFSLLDVLIDAGIEPKQNVNTHNFIDQVSLGH
jgi:hypothetical protein